jgi:hypothetical protein
MTILLKYNNSWLSGVQASRILIQPAKISKFLWSYPKTNLWCIYVTQPPLAAPSIILLHADAITVEASWICPMSTVYEYVSKIFNPSTVTLEDSCTKTKSENVF